MVSRRKGEPIETPEYASMLRRMIKSYAKRVAVADDVDLAEMIAMRRDLDEAVAVAVAGQRRMGSSWADVARGLGTTRQAAWERYGKSTVVEDDGVTAVTTG